MVEQDKWVVKQMKWERLLSGSNISLAQIHSGEALVLPDSEKNKPLKTSKGLPITNYMAIILFWAFTNEIWEVS